MVDVNTDNHLTYGRTPPTKRWTESYFNRGETNRNDSYGYIGLTKLGDIYD